MKPLIVTCSLLWVTAGCSTVTWVNDVSTSQDGKQVTVVGAEYRFEWGTPTASRPMRWNCQRSPDGKLWCKPDAMKLPQME